MITTTTPEIGAGPAPALPAELTELLRRMRLPHMRKAAPEVLATAKAQRWDPAEVLRVLLAEEVTGRERSALATRRAAAGFPTGKTFDAWNPDASSIPTPTQQALRTLEWVHRRENLVVCGPSGTGKTFLLEALGQQAVEHGLHVAWLRLEDLGVLLRRHRADDTVAKAITRLLKAELVIVDDIGLLPVATDAAEGLYRLVDAAYEKRSIAICVEPAPLRLRRAHAQNAGHRHRRPAAAPRPRLPNQRRQRPPDPSPGRQRGEAPALTPTVMAPDVQNPRPSPGKTRDRHRADFLSATGQKPMSLDTAWPASVPSFGRDLREPRERTTLAPALAAGRAVGGVRLETWVPAFTLVGNTRPTAAAFGARRPSRRPVC